MSRHSAVEGRNQRVSKRKHGSSSETLMVVGVLFNGVLVQGPLLKECITPISCFWPGRETSTEYTTQLQTMDPPNSARKTYQRRVRDVGTRDKHSLPGLLNSPAAQEVGGVPKSLALCLLCAQYPVEHTFHFHATSLALQDKIPPVVLAHNVNKLAGLPIIKLIVVVLYNTLFTNPKPTAFNLSSIVHTKVEVEAAKLRFSQTTTSLRFVLVSHS
jgi:hypothetical protein